MKKIDFEDFEIGYDKEKDYGYFEHNELGEELGGGLWFEKDTLVDFDGCMSYRLV